MRYVWLIIAALSFTQKVWGCNPNESCPTSCLRDIFSGQCTSISSSDPACEARKAACNGCISASALKLGASLQCVSCVVGTLAASAGTVTAACAAVCGGAAVVEKVARDSGC